MSTQTVEQAWSEWWTGRRFTYTQAVDVEALRRGFAAGWDVRDALAGVAAQPDTQRWIPVSERLPETEEGCLSAPVWMAWNKNVARGQYGSGKWYDNYRVPCSRPHFWQPIVIPAPPDAAMAAAAPQEEPNVAE